MRVEAPTVSDSRPAAGARLTHRRQRVPPDQDHVDREAREGWGSEHRGAHEFDETL